MGFTWPLVFTKLYHDNVVHSTCSIRYTVHPEQNLNSDCSDYFGNILRRDIRYVTTDHSH